MPTDIIDDANEGDERPAVPSASSESEGVGDAGSRDPSSPGRRCGAAAAAAGADGDCQSGHFRSNARGGDDGEGDGGGAEDDDVADDADVDDGRDGAPGGGTAAADSAGDDANENSKNRGAGAGGDGDGDGAGGERTRGCPSAKAKDDDAAEWNSDMEVDGGVIGDSRRPFPPGGSLPTTARPAPRPNEKRRDAFARRGGRVRAALTAALRAMADGLLVVGDASAVESHGGGKRGAIAGEGDGDGDCPREAWNARADFSHARKLAEEKSKECLVLTRELQESKAQIEVLQNENAASLQSNARLQSKIDRTLEALRITSGNAANARAEADASHARAEALSTQLHDLQSAMEDAARAVEAVRREHADVSRAARSAEGRLIWAESDRVRSVRAAEDATEERDALRARAEEAEALAGELRDAAEERRDEVRTLTKDLRERAEREGVRSERLRRVEAELREARGDLLEAASTAAEAESTVVLLRSAVEKLRGENESLHDRMNASQCGLAKDRAKHHEALSLAEREAQKWKMKFEEADEEARKWKMDNDSAEKQVDQLKGRVSNMERLLNDPNKQFSRTESVSSSSVTPHSSNLGFIGSFGVKDSSIVSEESKKRKYLAELPRREPSTAPDSSSRQLTYSYHDQKENAPNMTRHDQSKGSESIYGRRKRKVARTNKCCLCSKEGGMLLSCQCDNIGCDIQAHALCIGKFRSGKNDVGRTILCHEAGK